MISIRSNNVPKIIRINYTAEQALVFIGINKITIEAANSLRNLLGPHNSGEIDGICTPGSFYVGDGDVRFVASGFDGDAVIKIFE